MSDAFYNIIKEWTVRDYWTPGIKAEVIIDMLLSPFVADILCRKEKKQFILLAKEFPIRPLDSGKTARGNESFRNAKVDYLLASPDENALYLAELKTSWESVDWDQVERMIHAKKEPVSDLFYFYDGVRAHSVQKEKYARQEKGLREKSAKDPREYSKIRLAYLTLGDDEDIKKRLLEKDETMVVSSVLEKDLYITAPVTDEKKVLWNYVYDILWECIHPESRMNIKP